MDKMTNVKALNFVLESATLPDDVKDKLTALRDSLAKKSAGNAKPTAKQNANTELKAVVLANMVNGVQYKATELATAHEVSVQKMSALLKQLAESGAVVRTEVKRTPYYELAE